MIKILGGAIAILILILWYQTSQLGKFRDLSVQQSEVIRDQQATIAQNQKTMDKLNQSIAVHITETEKEQEKNGRITAQLIELRSKTNVKAWLNSMPDGVDKWLRKNYSKNKVPKVPNNKSISERNPRTRLQRSYFKSRKGITCSDKVMQYRQESCKNSKQIGNSYASNTRK